MNRLLALFALLVLPACVADGSDSRGGFATGEVPVEEPSFEDDLSDPTDPDEDEDAADNDDTTEDLTPLDWDSAPPLEVGEGWILEARIVCGLLDRSADKIWENTGTVWTELPSASDSRLLEGLEACAAHSDKVLRWDSEDSMYFEAAALGHWLEPTDTPGLWAGTVEPLGEVSPDCDAAMAQYGLTWPVPMTLEVLDVAPPEDAPGA